MGKYFCSCGEGTDVVETRISYARVRRRRKCPSCRQGFSTVEVPHETPKQLKKLCDWLGKQGLDSDIVHYAKSQVDEIVLGKIEDEEGNTGGTSPSN